MKADAGLMRFSAPALTALTGLLLASCSLKPSSQPQLSRAALNLRIHSDSDLSSSRATRALKLKTTDLPKTLAEFTCFGVNVTGSGVGASSESSTCKSGEGAPLGIYGGLVPLSGGEVQVTVPSGVPLVIQVFATITSDGTCADFAQILKRAALGTGPFYEVGRISKTILTADPVDVTIAFDSANARRAFCTSKDASTAQWDAAIWDSAVWAE